MLKYIRGVILVVAVLVANAYVPLTYATSANVLITHIQAGGVGAALQELIILYNNSVDEVDISKWCIKNKSGEQLGCFNPEHPGYGFYLAGQSYATIGSRDFVLALQPEGLSIVYIAMNGSSGGIVGSSDTISLVDQGGVIIDSHNWTTALTGGSMSARKFNAEEFAYVDTDQLSDWQVSMLQSIPPDGVHYRGELTDFCMNIEGIQTEVPEGLEIRWDGQCFPPPLPLLITELLPNASGTDDGKEFIEIYNPNDYDINLDGYSLNVGSSFEKSYNFPYASVIAAKSYAAFDNAVMGYSLLNSSSRVQLMRDIEIIDETSAYQDPREDTAWALIDDIWQYTERLTPGAKNSASLLPDVTDDTPPESTLKPCATNQYRHPETNRCRLIAVAVTLTPCRQDQYRSKETNRCRKIVSSINTLKPCDKDQERNPETGRCRKIAVATEYVPCKNGQERSPETNRCRTIVAMTQADYAVLGTQTSSNGSWYIWAAIAGLILAALGYAVWEWRYELRKFFTVLSSRFARRRK
jgi:hypothetical protein